MIVFDIETSGLDYTAEDFKIHCICTEDTETGEKKEFLKDNIGTGFNYLNTRVFLENDCGIVAGHNIINFDIPALEYYMKFSFFNRVYDTRVLSGLMFPQYTSTTGHSLAAWGKRLGLSKTTDFQYADFSKFTPEMLEQCKRDVSITVQLVKLLQSQNYSQQAIDLELKIAQIIQKQIENGIQFDIEKANILYDNLKIRREEIVQELQKIFPEVERQEIFIPKRDDSIKGYIKDKPFVKTIKENFNPSSNDNIAERLIEKYNWRPQQLTPTGKPKVARDILEQLDYPETKLLVEHSKIEKVIGMLAEGTNGWLKLVTNGRIHGQVITTGTVTGRMTHFKPNLAQTVAPRSFMGEECRSLFIAAPGKVLVGCDAAGLEARCAAHYVAMVDKGAMARLVEETDIHRYIGRILFNKENLIDVTLIERGMAKQTFFGFLYGAQPKKLSKILNISEKEATRLRNTLINKFPALEQFNKVVYNSAKKGFLKGIDGRKIMIERNKWGNPDAPVNYLIQSLGAVIMKQATIIADTKFTILGNLVKKVLDVHDETLWECDEKDSEFVAEILENSITQAGEYFNLKCKLVGEAQIGKNWKEIH